MTFACLFCGRNSLSQEPVRTARDLGVMLDSNLTFNEHIVSTPCLHVCLY